jgi:hypothetical protein
VIEMAFTAVSGDIPLQPGTKAYNCFASGSITKGQGVYAIDWSPTGSNIYVGVPAVTSQVLFGVAAYAAASGEPVAVYGPGNLVACKLSGSQSAGTLVGLYADGMLHNLVKYAKCAVVTKGVTSSGDGEVLILGNVLAT